MAYFQKKTSGPRNISLANPGVTGILAYIFNCLEWQIDRSREDQHCDRNCEAGNVTGRQVNGTGKGENNTVTGTGEATLDTRTGEVSSDTGIGEAGH